MPYTYKNSKGDVFARHQEGTRLAAGRTRSVHYFSRDICCAIDEFPKGYVVDEDKTGMPRLRKS